VPELGPSSLGEDRIDVTFKVEEQNRNQFTFGGGVSGLEGTFINASFSTANFLGLGETVQVSAQAGARTKNYQLAITEPYLLDRPITAGFDLYSRKLDYLTSLNVVGYSEVRTGASFTTGLPVGRRGFTRLFGNYTYEVIDTSSLTSTTGTGTSTSSTVPTTSNAPALTPNPFVVAPGGPIVINRPATATEPIFSPFLDSGRHIESRVGPSLVRNTVDNPYTPRRGLNLSATVTVAGGPLGGTVEYVKPDLQAIVYLPHTRKTALGLRAEGSWIRAYGNTTLPYYERFFLGGETQIRGTNIHTVGPVDPANHAVGGNKFVLFNAEYYFDVGGPLRLVLFYDAGQAFKETEVVNLRQLRTSSGAELRFIMPVLNVPFRLIYAWNLNRDAFQPPRTFKFAVGTTF